MANDDDGVDQASRSDRTSLANSIGLIVSIFAAAFGGTGLYVSSEARDQSQDRFTASEWREAKADMHRLIEANKAATQSHLAAHPDTRLRDRIRDLELGLQRMETEVRIHHK